MTTSQSFVTSVPPSKRMAWTSSTSAPTPHDPDVILPSQESGWSSFAHRLAQPSVLPLARG